MKVSGSETSVYGCSRNETDHRISEILGMVQKYYFQLICHQGLKRDI